MDFPGRSDLQESDGFKSPHFRLAVRISEDDALKFARIDERLFQLSGTLGHALGVGCSFLVDF